jgi:hypothetical protein
MTHPKKCIEAARLAMINAPLDKHGATFLGSMMAITRANEAVWNEHKWREHTTAMAEACLAGFFDRPAE